MTIKISRRLLDHFRREAKRIFPKEAYAALLGESKGGVVKVTQLFFPEDQERYATKKNIPYSNTWLTKATVAARLVGLGVLGEIHSHPENSRFEHDAAPSQDDWERASDASTVHGICSIRKYPSGRIITRIKFWPKLPLLKEKITS